jgi:HK97 gp10 family phage protein
MAMMEVLGLKELELRLSELPEKLKTRVLAQSLQSGARLIEAQAEQNAPVSVAPHILKSYASAMFKTFKSKRMGVWLLPGNLKRNIKVKRDLSGTRGHALTYEVFVKNKDAWYWKFVEFGTRKMAAHPFMRPAFETQKGAAVLEVAAQMEARMQSEGIVDGK